MSITPDRWQRIKELLASALACPPADRAALVRDAAAGDAELAAEVESLLAAHDSAGSFLEEPPLASTAAPTAIGRTVGSYRIDSLIAIGGMAEVYLAHDLKLDRPVAIKLLPHELVDDPARLRRFHQEARAASTLNHPHILVIHDFGALDGRPFIVTEFVEGETLRERLRRGALPFSDAVEIAIQIAGALGAAHARGIVHRDIKPENVMVRPDGVVKVVDFGLAKLAEPGMAADVVATQQGLLVGTPRYMSPEQVRGATVDARADVWSLGAVLYEMVTGVPPFAAATPADLLAAIVDREPLPVVLRAPALPSTLDRIITRALRKDPAVRFAAMADMIAELTAARRQLELAAPPPGPPSGSSGAVEATPRGRTAPRTRLIVLPFRLLRPDAELEFMTFSLADAIATTVSGLDSILVRSSLAA